MLLLPLPKTPWRLLPLCGSWAPAMEKAGSPRSARPAGSAMRVARELKDPSRTPVAAATKPAPASSAESGRKLSSEMMAKELRELRQQFEAVAASRTSAADQLTSWVQHVLADACEAGVGEVSTLLVWQTFYGWGSCW